VSRFARLALLPVSAAHPGPRPHQHKEKTLNTKHNKLALRKQSIRILTADELHIAHGGNGTGTGGGNGTHTKHTTVPTTGTHTGQTVGSTDLTLTRPVA
jgi:hypothetical protein